MDVAMEGEYIGPLTRNGHHIGGAKPAELIDLLVDELAVDVDTEVEFIVVHGIRSYLTRWPISDRAPVQRSPKEVDARAAPRARLRQRE